MGSCSLHQATEESLFKAQQSGRDAHRDEGSPYFASLGGGDEDEDEDEISNRGIEYFAALQQSGLKHRKKLRGRLQKSGI